MDSFIWIKKSRIKKTAVILVLLFTLLCFCYWQNNVIVITKILYSNKNIPASFNGYKILQISDLHNKTFGRNQSILLKKTREIQPDIILLTGDLTDGLRTNINISMQYVKEAVKIAPIYYVI
jgi:predicted MPP superfamily phosphohydrolase